MSDYYVILTGSKNNAGDFLIKHRAKSLLSHFRPDRHLVDMDAWKALDENDLDVVNNSRALILLGGPSLQYHMYPGIYPLVHDLSSIKVPISVMGIGWKSISGRWKDTYNYPLSEQTMALLTKISQSGLPMSLRDYHTVNVLGFKGFEHLMMTGCPASYDLSSIGQSVQVRPSVGKVAFSLGVSFVSSSSMRKAMEHVILKLRDYFYESSDFEVVFHHGLDPDAFLKTHGSTLSFNQAHVDFSRWLSDNEIRYVDISGSAEALIEYYSSVDLHIGYRVHAHIFMSSISRSSLLIAEDGRGRAVERAMGGIVMDGVEKYSYGISSRIMERVGMNRDRYKANGNISDDVLLNLVQEMNSGNQRLMASRKVIDCNFEVMKSYIHCLP